MTFSERFRVKPDISLRFSDLDPNEKDKFIDSEDARAETETYAHRMEELQYRLFAERKRGLLICLQAMDAGGKDGVIRHVLGYMNPQGCRVVRFAAPSEEENRHDFLWRIHRVISRKGEVVIFNRSHYEDVLVPRVHESLPESVLSSRIDAINAFEDYLTNNDVHILKFFLHISKEEQLSRFKKRIDDPNRWWKISEADYNERQYWHTYEKAYEEILYRCNSERTPWFVIPANHKWYRNLVVSRIVVEYMESMDIKFPEPTVDIEHIKHRYHHAKN